MTSLDSSERIRYQRHLHIPEMGEAGQLKLKEAAVAVVGVGGLGSAIALYLAAAGVGHIGLVDSDKVELSNLQRQILYNTNAIGQAKVYTAQARLHKLNPTIQVDVYPERLTEENTHSILEPYSVILDGTDNFDTRFLLNDYCVRMVKPYIYGAINQLQGQASVFDARKGPCFRCLYPEMPSEEVVALNRGVGVVGAVPGIIGSIEALECIKIITGIGQPLVGRMLLMDGNLMEFRVVEIRKRENCKQCGAVDASRS